MNPSHIVWRSYGALFARNLRLMRGLRGLSQEELAMRSHMSRNAISNMERNEGNVGRPADPMLSTVFRLSAALRIPPIGLIPNPDHFVERIAKDYGLGVNGLWPVAPEGIRPFDKNHRSGAGLIIGDSSDYIRRIMPLDRHNLRVVEVDRLQDIVVERRENPEKFKSRSREDFEDLTPAQQEAWERLNIHQDPPIYDPRFGPEFL